MCKEFSKQSSGSIIYTAAAFPRIYCDTKGS